MAVTRLTDAVVPSVFNPYVLKETKEKTSIFTSGILRNDANLASFLSGGGQTINVPFWKDLPTAEPNTSSDDPAVSATPAKITSGTDIAIRINRNNGWSDADLVAELAGDDPMKAIGSRVAAWWARAFQAHMVAMLKGVFADNIANDAGDMVRTVGTDAVGASVAAERISAENILDTAQTMGDASSVLSTLIMHSVQYTALAKLNLIDFIPDSEGRVNFPSYLGYKVIVDDGVPAVAGTNRIMYWTFLVGMNAIGWAESPPAVPTETIRKPDQGNGGGVEELWSRRQYIMHPYGIKFTSSSLAGKSPTNTELATAANWDRVVVERKQVSLALLRSNS
jgi:hypothetical protein